MITAKQLRRPIRFLILLGLALTVGLYIRSRPEKLMMQPDDRSMIPAYYPGSALKARPIDSDFELKRGRDVLYVVEANGEQKGFIGRVQGMPGDAISVNSGFLTCNGEFIGPAKIPDAGLKADILAEVPAGYLCIFNVNPDVRYFDSRRFGFVPRDDVQAIILGEIR